MESIFAVVVAYPDPDPPTPSNKVPETPAYKITSLIVTPPKMVLARISSISFYFEPKM
jgi:hypothetical protein